MVSVLLEAEEFQSLEEYDAALQEHRELAMLFRTLATLRTDVPVFNSVDDLKWRGPAPEFERVAQQLGVPGLWDRARRVPLTD